MTVLFACLSRFERLARRVNRRPALWLTVCAGLLAIQISPWWYATPDGCLYLGMARKIAEPVQNSGAADLPVGVPPGYPLLISPAFLFGQRPFLILSVINWATALALIAGVYCWGRRQIPPAALWLALATAANAGVWYYYRRTLKEIAFMAVSIWTVNALDALIRSETRRQLLLRFLAAIGLLAAAVMVRYSAVVLVVGFGMAMLLRAGRTPHRRAAAVGVVLLLGTLTAAVLGGVLAARGTLYLQGFETLNSDVWTRLAEGLHQRVSEVQRICAPFMFKAYARRGEWIDWNIALGLLLLSVIAFGWRRLAVERGDVLALTLPVYAGLYVAWPFDQGARFMVPMVPVLIACFWCALDRFHRVRHLFFASCVTAHLAASVGYWVLIDAPRTAADNARWASAEKMAEQIELSHGRVAYANISNELRCMVQVCLDDPLSQPWLRPSNRDPQPGWIVQPANDPLWSGFALAEQAESWRLLKRVEPRDESPPPKVAGPERNRFR